MNKLILILLFPLCIASCSVENVADVHHRAVLDGYTKLPIAKSLKDDFGAWSFITHFNLPTRGYKDTEKDWQTVAYLYGRYEVQYVQKVEFDKDEMKVVAPIDGGRLTLKEISRIFRYDGSVATDYGDDQFVLEGVELQKLFESRWDFSSIGKELNKTPVENIEWGKNYWNRIYPLQFQ